MTIEFYIFNLFLFLFYSILINKSQKNSKRSSLSLFIISAIHLLVIQSFFDTHILLDSDGYIEAFEDVHFFTFYEAVLDGFINEWGVGFMIYNKLISYFTNDAHLYYMMTYVIIDIPLLWYFYKVSNNYQLSLLLYLFHPMLFWDSNYILRQHMAISLSAVALYYSDKKTISIPMSIVAASMHLSAIIVLLYLVWKKINISKASLGRIVFLVVLSLLIIGMLFYQILAQSVRYSKYMDADKSSNIMPFLLLGPLVLFLFYKRKCFWGNMQESNLFDFLLFGLVIIVFTMNSSFGRITTYFISFIPAAVPLVFKYSYKNKLIPKFFVLFLFVIEGYMLYMSCSNLFVGNLIQ